MFGHAGKILVKLAFLATVYLAGSASAWAAPPVRIAVVPGGGSGQEQSACDRISASIEQNPNVALSTVNPDWYVVVNIIEQPDQAAGAVKVNGTVTIKTVEGQILNTISVQTNKSDYSLSPGAPLNKALVQQAVVEVINGMAQRAVSPIENAVAIEIATRDRIINAQGLADKDEYDEAIGLLAPITPDTTHFRAVRALIGEFQMEKQSLALWQKAQALASRSRYSEAIRELSAVSNKSKRYRLARQEISRYRAKLGKVKPGEAGARPQAASSGDQLKALEAQEKALEAQRKAIEAQKAAIKARSAK